jgi:putative transposase
MSETQYGISAAFAIPDKLWEEIKPLIPPLAPKKKAGRRRMDDRQALTAIVYVLRTGIQWKALPESLGKTSTVHDRFQAWQATGLFERLWQEGLYAYDELVGIDWDWLAVDGAMTKAPLGGKRYRRKPYRPRQVRHQAQSVG